VVEAEIEGLIELERAAGDDMAAMEAAFRGDD
jgi:hypothetical protein